MILLTEETTIHDEHMEEIYVHCSSHTVYLPSTLVYFFNCQPVRHRRLTIRNKYSQVRYFKSMPGNKALQQMWHKPSKRPPPPPTVVLTAICTQLTFIVSYSETFF
jgi:hypothetical protein